jgi:SAM-dependent methyltransferase
VQDDHKQTLHYGGFMNDILAGYAASSAELIARFEALSTTEVLAPVLDLLPSTPVRVADVGAGTGRDASWFAARGHHVLAVEPVAELRAAGISRHPSSRITWLDDQLPALSITRKHEPFNLVTLCAVWQHLSEDARQVALQSLSDVTALGGLLIMSLRHGAGAPDRPVFTSSVADTIAAATDNGFALLREVDAASVQAVNHASGVRWTWLALKKVG